MSEHRDACVRAEMEKHNRIEDAKRADHVTHDGAERAAVKILTLLHRRDNCGCVADLIRRETGCAELETALKACLPLVQRCASELYRINEINLEGAQQARDLACAALAKAKARIGEQLK